MSSRLTSSTLMQISENRELSAVFADLLDPEGSELYLKPVERYLTLGQPVNFHTAVASASARGEVAIGYRIDKLGHKAGSAYGVTVNPRKSTLVTFSPGDSMIVLAEE
ncbi:MAG: hypothetical protein ACR2OO_09990 [Thermomicrobiales bacterium]